MEPNDFKQGSHAFKYIQYIYNISWTDDIKIILSRVGLSTNITSYITILIDAFQDAGARNHNFIDFVSFL